MSASFRTEENATELTVRSTELPASQVGRVIEPVSVPRLVPINNWLDWRDEYEPWLFHGAWDRYLHEQMGKREAEQLWLREAA